MAELREQGRLDRIALTQGFDKIENALLIIANRDHNDRINQLGSILKPIIKYPDGDHSKEIAYLSDLFYNLDSQLYFQNVVQTTRWWIDENQADFEKIDSQITITQQLFAYWTGEFFTTISNLFVLFD